MVAAMHPTGDSRKLGASSCAEQYYHSVEKCVVVAADLLQIVAADVLREYARRNFENGFLIERLGSHLASPDVTAETGPLINSARMGGKMCNRKWENF